MILIKIIKCELRLIIIIIYNQSCIKRLKMHITLGMYKNLNKRDIHLKTNKYAKIINVKKYNAAIKYLVYKHIVPPRFGF